MGRMGEWLRRRGGARGHTVRYHVSRARGSLPRCRGREPCEEGGQLTPEGWIAIGIVGLTVGTLALSLLWITLAVRAALRGDLVPALRQE